MPIDMTMDTPAWPRRVHLGFVVATLVTASIAALIALGRLPCLVFALAGGSAVVGWWRTSSSASGDIRATVVPVVASTAALLATLTEAWAGDLAGFVESVAPWSSPVLGTFTERSLLIAGYLLISASTFGAWAAWYRHPLGGCAAWFTSAIAIALAIGLSVLSAVAMRYAPGLVSALVCGAVGLYTLKTRLRIGANDG